MKKVRLWFEKKSSIQGLVYSGMMMFVISAIVWYSRKSWLVYRAFNIAGWVLYSVAILGMVLKAIGNKDISKE